MEIGVEVWIFFIDGVIFRLLFLEILGFIFAWDYVAWVLNEFLFHLVQG